MLLMLLPMLNQAQQGSDQLGQRRKGHFKYLPSGVRFGSDITNLGETLLLDGRKKYQFLADIDFNRFIVVIEGGKDESTREEIEFTYNNEGDFQRIGFEYNLLGLNEKHNGIFAGLRYAQSNFKDELQFPVESVLFGNEDLLFTREGVSANWFEVTASMKIKVWKLLYLGYTFRFKLALDQDETGSFNTFSIPGFGRADGTTDVGLNFHALIRIPFRKKYIPPPPPGRRRR